MDTVEILRAYTAHKNAEKQMERAAEGAVGVARHEGIINEYVRTGDVFFDLISDPLVPELEHNEAQAEFHGEGASRAFGA